MAISFLRRLPFPRSVIQISTNFLPILVLSLGLRDQYADYITSQPFKNYKQITTEYDFIIGAGSAGSIIAHRLSSNPNYKVLLLEDGGNPSPIQSVPFLFFGNLHIPQIDYDFYTVPQKNACLALKNQKSFWPRGRGLGGSSNLNSMLFQRGSPYDYDRWAELSGSDEWKFDNVLRNFKNIEDYHGKYYNDKWHSQDGRGVHVSTVADTNLLNEFFQGGEEMGYPTLDVNGRQVPSFSRLDVSVKEGRRFGAYQAFLKPILTRKNLRIHRYARATKIHLNDLTKMAYGVTYKRHGVEYFVRATREIVISAGAIDSPKLLMLSGIGPKRHLENLGIKCIIDLPVGQNLQDHILVPFGPFTLEKPDTTTVSGRDITVNTVINYFASEQKGILATALGANAVAYIHSSLSKSRARGGNITEKAPDIQLVLLPSNLNLPDVIEKAASIKPGLHTKYLKGFEKKDSFTVTVMLGKSNSRGEMRLASVDPYDKPILNPKYLSHPDDIRILVDGMNFTVNMVENTKGFQKLGGRLIPRKVPGCEQFNLKSEQYYECFARHLTFTVYHHCGTCSMGKGPQDPKAVVDSKLRVLHVTGLRVVDASVIPEVPNSNINAAVYMLADKASEFILDYWVHQ